MDVGNKLLLGTGLVLAVLTVLAFSFTESSLADNQGVVNNPTWTPNDQGGKDYKVTIYDGISSSEKISP